MSPSKYSMFPALKNFEIRVRIKEYAGKVLYELIPNYTSFWINLTVYYSKILTFFCEIWIRTADKKEDYGTTIQKSITLPAPKTVKLNIGITDVVERLRNKIFWKSYSTAISATYDFSIINVVTRKYRTRKETGIIK